MVMQLVALQRQLDNCQASPFPGSSQRVCHTIMAAADAKQASPSRHGAISELYDSVHTSVRLHQLTGQCTYPVQSNLYLNQSSNTLARMR